MITQTNFQGSDTDPADIKNEMSPQTIHAPSFEDDDFDLPQVNKTCIKPPSFCANSNLELFYFPISSFLTTIFLNVKQRFKMWYSWDLPRALECIIIKFA